jgi:hypothetical protein
LIIELGYISKKSNGSSILNKSINDVNNATFNGLMLGIGILWNSRYASMNMPIGYYTGFSIDFVKGNLSNTIPKNMLSERLEWKQYNYAGYMTTYYNDGTTNTNELIYTFKTSGYHFNFYYGKNIYLSKNITMDLCIKWGFAYYRYKPTNFTPYPVNTYDYNVEEPYHIGSPNEGGYTLYDKTDNIYYIKNSGFNLLPDLYSSAIAQQINADGSISSSSSSNLLYGNSGLEKASTINKFKFILLPQIKIGYLF